MTYKIGMPSLVEFENIEDNMKICRELGLDFVELNMNLPYCLPSNNDVKRLKEFSDNYNVGFSVHFPEEIDFGTFYSSIRKANINFFEEVAKFSNGIGANIINIHLNTGIYFSLPNDKVWIYRKHKEDYLNNLLHSFSLIDDIAKEYGIKVCIENTKIVDFIEEAIIKLINFENIFFTWDIGHDAKDEFKARDIYLKNKEKIAHIHMHDYDGIKDHQILFDGNLGIEDTINFAKEKNISVVIEVKTLDSLKESVERLKERNFI